MSEAVAACQIRLSTDQLAHIFGLGLETQAALINGDVSWFFVTWTANAPPKEYAVAANFLYGLTLDIRLT